MSLSAFQQQRLLDVFVHIRHFLELITHESHLWTLCDGGVQCRVRMKQITMREFSTNAHNHIVLFWVKREKKILLSKDI